MDGVDFADVKHYSTGFQEEKLCHKEPSYRDYVDVLCSRNPCLLNLLSFLNAPQTSSKKCQITALDFHKGKPYPSTRHLPQNIDLLPRELQGKSKGEGKEEDECRDRSLQGRILVIEDLTADVIELLGSSLDIDPLFFALHLHTTSRNDMLSQTPDEATLPSRLVSQDYMNTTYHRPLMCEKMPSARERLVRDMSVKRKLVFIRSTTIGLAQHCVSVIKVNKSSSFWIALLLVDPQLSEIYYPSAHKDDTAYQMRLSLRPFLGAYEDFMPPPKFSSDWQHLDESPRGGMASEVVRYWERAIPPSFDTQDPRLESLAYYPLKIVAAEWVKYVAVMQHCIKMYEYRGDQLPSLEQFNMDLRELQGWRRRSMVSQQKVRTVIRQLKSNDSTHVKNQTSIQHLVEDYEVISNNIKHAGRRLENMLPVVTSLVQIIDARQSFAETTNISRLTILALIFVPLNFVSSLFSMNENNGPGGQEFWVYFVVAIPITVLVFLIARPPTAFWRGLERFTIPKKKNMLSRRSLPGDTAGSASEA